MHQSIYYSLCIYLTSTRGIYDYQLSSFVYLFPLSSDFSFFCKWFTPAKILKHCFNCVIYYQSFLVEMLWNHTYSWGQCSWISKILLVRGEVISWLTGLWHYNARKFISSLNVRWDVNLWVRVTHEIYDYQPPTNNSTVIPQCF